MNATKYKLLFLLILLTGQLLPQEEDYFKSDLYPPLDIPLYLSGTFGELRSNHFHSGLDIKTQGVIGLKVYASADGYVSRIKVSPNGYGKVLYVTHADGFVTVYGHLNKFNDRIHEYVKTRQYQKESFDIQIFPSKDELKVKKGEIIGYSGSTGGSSGPHLHYELRDQSSQHPINPLFFNGIEVKDTYKPKILELVVYPVDKSSLINGKNDTLFIMVSGSGVNHYLDLKNPISLSGRISFGIRAYDPMDDISNKNGVYQIEMKLDTIDAFKIEMDKLSFATTRYMNSLIDYGYYKKMRRRVIRTQIDTNNRLFNYRDVLSNGIYTFDDSSKHSVSFFVKDYYRNTARLHFNVKSVPHGEIDADPDIPKGEEYFSLRKQNKFSSGNLSLSFPSNSFYQSFYFQFDTLVRERSMHSPFYMIHSKFTPVHKHFEISIIPDSNSYLLMDKLFIAVVNGVGSWYIGSEIKGNAITARSRLFGNYTLLADTIPPKIKPVNISNKKNIRGQKTIRVKIVDKETGIGKFRGTLNGQWILMEYDPKINMLIYEVDERLKEGKNTIRVEVEDMLKNKSEYSAVVIN